VKKLRRLRDFYRSAPSHRFQWLHRDFLLCSMEAGPMTSTPDHCRLLIVAPHTERQTLRSLIAQRLPAWEVAEADGVERARFGLQLDPCDLLLLDAEPARAGGALRWFTEVQPLPITMLADDDDDFLHAALESGATSWLPRALALRHGGLLATVLRRAALRGELCRRMREAEVALADCRCQVNRLVNRLWETVPSQLATSWFTQRHMLERLQEELSRVGRHGGPLTVVLGELLTPDGGGAAVADELAVWAAEHLSRCKRRSDVAGQYGPNGFMMVLPRTPEPAALGCCERLRTLLEQPASSLRGPLRACFGVAAVDAAEGASVTKLLSRAEERLEEAKTGRESR
jgi:diguanylate cyclase (GGDEF)-like protein